MNIEKEVEKEVKKEFEKEVKNLKKEKNVKKEKKEENDEMKESFGCLLSTISSLKIQLTGLHNQIKSVERIANKKIKQLEREKKKNKGNKKPSGFANPTKISEELCTFMELPNGSERARTVVTQYIIKYIKDNELQDPINAKVIQPNNKLQTLLELGNEDDLTYFNIQRHMNKHFLKCQ